MFASADNIKDMTIPWLFQDIQRAKKTGTAVFEQDPTIKKVFFRQGDIIFASSNRDDERLGDFLLNTGKITRPQFEKASEVAGATGRQLGAVLVEARMLTPHDLVDQAKLEVKQIILRLFSWRSGRYRFDDGPLPLTEIVPLSMSTGDLIIEGLRDLDGEIVRASLPLPQTILRPVADPALLFQKAQLEQDQQSVITLIDGNKSIQEISCLSGLAEIQALKAIYVLLALRMAEKGEIKNLAEKEFVCELVREAFAAGQKKTAPAAAEPSALKQMIQSAYDNLAIQNHYELLGVGHAASVDEVKRAYFTLAKLYHPDRRFEAEMRDMKEKLEALFDRIHEAYETLNSPAERKQYNIDLASGTAAHRTANRARTDKPDNTAAAAAVYQEGLKQMNGGNFWGAEEAFQTALRLDPGNAEYFFRRGLALSRVPRRGHEAEEYLVKAAGMAPKKTEYALELCNFYIRTDQKVKALPLLQNALKHDPDSEKIKQALKKAGGQS